MCKRPAGLKVGDGGQTGVHRAGGVSMVKLRGGDHENSLRTLDFIQNTMKELKQRSTIISLSFRKVTWAVVQRMD